MKSLFREMFGELTAWGKFWLYLGLATLVCAAAMSFSFGNEISFKHAMFLMCLTAIAAFLPEAAYAQWEDGRKIVAVVLATLAVPTLLIELYTHAGYTAGLRGSNIESAHVQNRRYDGAQKTAEENTALLATFKAQLAKLRAENEWTTSVSADALRKQIVVHDKAIENETARKGCKTKCEGLMRDKATLEGRIATIEQDNDLSRRIEGMQAVVDKKRVDAGGVEHKSSAVEHQKRSLAKWVSMAAVGSLKPSEMIDEGAQETVNFAMAVAGTGLPALSLFIAGLYRRREQHPAAWKAVTSPLGTLPQNLRMIEGYVRNRDPITGNQISKRIHTAAA